MAGPCHTPNHVTPQKEARHEEHGDSPLGAEALGTLFFVLFGAGAAVAVSGDSFGAALAWALALVVAVWAFSAGGGHLNPFVTLGLAVRGRFGWAKVPGHIIAQLVGGLAGALLAWWL